MIVICIRSSNERGYAEHGWLQSHHSFSFANYYDPAHMGVSALRVINDDVVAPGRGFATHSHKDMEIISYVKKGQIQHKDSEGNTRILPAGEFQLMTAGSGITHSEYNPSLEETLEFLQIWIVPDKGGVEPGYQQKQFPAKSGLNLVVSPDGNKGSLSIHQDAQLYHLLLNQSEQIDYTLISGRTVYIHMIKGKVMIDDNELNPGDGIMVKDVSSINLKAEEAVEALVFDLP